MKRTLLAAAGAALVVSAAGAASAQDWSGPYLGVTVGYGQVDDEDDERTPFDTNLDGNFNDTVRTAAGADAFSSSPTTPAGFCGGSPNANNFAAGCSDDEEEGDFSVRAGYDWQAGPIVYGVVGELAKVNAEDNATAFSTTPAQYSFKRDVDTMAALRGRVGYALGRFLPYATAGVAHAEVENTYMTSNGVNSFTPRRSDSGETGFQVGAGVEAALTDRVRVGLEYLYTEFEDDGLTVRVGPGAAPATNPFLLVNPQGTDQRRGSDEFKLQQARVTVSFAF